MVVFTRVRLQKLRADSDSHIPEYVILQRLLNFILIALLSHRNETAEEELQRICTGNELISRNYTRAERERERDRNTKERTKERTDDD